MRKETIGNCELYLGDCLEVMPTLGKVDAVVTDPPYGVHLGKKPNNQNFDREEYISYEDTPDNIFNICVPAIEFSLSISTRCAMTPGVKNMFSYPKPDHVGAIYYPAATGCNSWGFSCWQPIFYYGKDPHAGKGSAAESFQSTEAAEKNGHPCPKPINQMKWIVKKTTKAGEKVLDPFMGSGTTGVACVKLGRKFIGIELEEKYFDIACKRVEQAYKQPDMFIEPIPEAVQESLI